MPKEIEKLGVTVCNDLKEGLKDADVVNILRVQRTPEKNLFPTLREYATLFGVNSEKLKYANRTAW